MQTALAATTVSASLTLGQVLANCIPFCTGAREASGGDRDLMCRVDMLSGPDRVSATVFSNAGWIYTNASVVEFDPAEVNVCRYTASISAGSTSTNVAITSVDTAKSFVVLSTTFDGFTTSLRHKMLRYRFTSSTNLEISRLNTDGNMSIRVFVAESIGAAWNVQHDTITIAAAASQADLTISMVATSRTWNICSFQTDESTANPQNGTASCELLNSTTVRLQRVGTTGTIQAAVQTITLGAGLVQHDELDIASGAATDSVTIGTAVDLSLATIWGVCYCGWGTTIGRSYSSSLVGHFLIKGEFSSTTQIDWERFNTTNRVVEPVQTIEWSDQAPPAANGRGYRGCCPSVAGADTGSVFHTLCGVGAAGSGGVFDQCA